MALVPGSTVHIPDTGPARDKGKSHLFVVLTSPCGKGMIQLVPICTVRGKFDDTCEVAPGEHSFVEAMSYAAYYHVCQFRAAVLEEQIQKNIIRTNDPISAELLKRICDGVLVSRHTLPTEKKYYQEQLDATAKLQKKMS